MSFSYTDSNSTTWSVDGYGNARVSSGSVSGFDSGASLSLAVVSGGVASTIYPSYGSATTTATGQSVTATATSGGASVSVVRSSEVISDGSGHYFLRLVETLTNTGSATTAFRATISDDFYADGSTALASTSSGDANYTSADDWYVTNHAFTPSRPSFAHVVSGGARSPSSVGYTSADPDSFATSYNVTLAAGSSATIVHFIAVGSTASEAATQAAALSTLPASALAGLSPAQLQSLINFTSDVTSASTATLASYQRNLTLTGTAAINGTGNDLNNVITGNSASNRLVGLGGDDTLDGGLGADTLEGGLGNDTYVVDNSGDVVIEGANAGIDLVRSSISYSIASRPYIENITLTGVANISATGNSAGNVLTGNTGNNTLSGGEGGDTLNGGGGTDTLNGGGGDDTYIVDSTTDTIIDAAGVDTINSSVSFSLAAHSTIERLTLTGSANINGTGNALANLLVGNSGTNRLDGGTGSDTMRGGLGNDVYVVRDAGDAVIENASQGTDRVEAYVSHTLSTNVENLTLLGAGALQGVGNTLSNVLIGNAGNNRLYGLAGNDTLNGGDGVDTLNGGTGNDTYIVDTTTDTIVDSSGTDTVRSSVSFSLASSATVENLTLVGTSSINGYGNDIDNIITGNNGNNLIDGRTGSDTASYITATSGVTVSLALSTTQATGGAGSDRLVSIENLIGSAYGDVLTGNSGNNVLSGGDGADRLTGGSGDDVLNGDDGDDRLIDTVGNDVMNGGTGNDTYVVAGAGGSIIIQDGAGVDTIDASGASGGATIDLTPGASSNINGRLVTLSAGGTVDVPLDVLFMQDCSGSFGDDVSTVRSLVPEVVATLNGIQSDNRFGLASFIDHGEYVYQTNLTMTNSASALVTALNGLTIGSGGDTPESQIEALMHAAMRTGTLGFRSDSMRVAVVMTDAPFHVAGDSTYPPNDGDAVIELEDYPTIALLKARLIAANIIPVFAVTAGNESYYTSLVNALGFGTVVTLASDSSNLVSALTTGIIDITEARIENAIGTSHNDTLIGNALANRLTGGLGNDTYYVQGTEDFIVETATGGRDLAVSSGNYVLGNYVDDLTLAGTDDINGTGNALANVIVGNSGNNRIDGGGGIDRMIGGRGDDTYVISTTSDVVVENSTGGVDTIESALSYVLGTNLENLTLTGTSAISGVGNSAANTIIGNAAANTLNGSYGNDTLEGAGGLDQLIGGSGADTFVYRTLADGGDTIADFVSGTDRIAISSSTFGGYLSDDFDYTSHTLLASSFVNVATSSTSYSKPYDETFVYHAYSGTLYFDRDGAGTTYGEVALLTLNGPRTLVAEDIILI